MPKLIDILYAMTLAAIALWAATATTLLYADVYAYSPTRAVIQDSQLSEFEVPETTGPDTYILPDQTLYEDQSVSVIDTKTNLIGDLVIWTNDESGVIERIAYSIQACMPLETTGDLYIGTQQCYSVADAAEMLEYSFDGRVYTMRSAQGQDYDVHWVRRETDPTAFDPSAIFQLNLQQPGRNVMLLLFYRLVGAE